MKSTLGALFSGAILALTSLNANAVHLEYKGFYQRLEKLEKNELENINIAFYLVTEPQRQPCNIASAQMETKDSKQDIAFTERAQLDIPFSEQLYKEKAILFVEEGQPYQQCTLQMQIQAKFEGNSFSFAELATYTHEMDVLMEDFGGFLWFIMPSVDGLTFRFEKPSSVSFIHSDLQENLSCDGNQCQLFIDTEDKRTERAIEFISAPQVISPFVSK